MLKKSASGVLASFRPSACPRGYALGPSLAAALRDGLFEHPAWHTPTIQDVRTSEVLACPHSVSAAYDVSSDSSLAEGMP